ncbi:MAG TPA: HAMP domain-containing methyl-accepting chemotaxis protein [Rhodopila sp.]|uniref:methyl-accepting chemotaxis protein n=1 Tax=Rhodopila sp. TaxID=2480087 RepID=UPI002D18D778|nr:HAMP domain-containing methyl-accepting chemotaxis protein [Rhodopila sp.]HVY16289.1 HAMP domain-containing methyl-accepting chemotaxis protein [Rhodopila sp.]
MLNRLSLDHLLKLTLSILAAALIALICLRLSHSWTVLARGERAEQVVAASRQIFTALVNMRTDRSTVQRSWQAEAGLTPVAKAALDGYLRAEVPAMAAAVPLLQDIAFDRKTTLMPALHASMERMETLRRQFFAGIAMPKPERTPGLGQAYFNESLKLQGLLENISASLFARVKDDNPFISQMLSVKQLAWLVRLNTGEASLLISQSLGKGEALPDLKTRWSGYQGGARVLWDVIDDTVTGLDLPKAFSETLASARQTLFAPDYMAVQQGLIDALLTGQKPDRSADVWSNYTVPKMAVMMAVADAALQQARVSANAASEAARTDVAWQAALLLASLAGVLAGFLFVTRRITSPLLRLRAATERLAAGDFTAETDLGRRRDEIGSIAAALGTFRQQAIEKTRIEEEQRGTRERAEQRQRTMEGHIADFQGSVAETLRTLDAARGQLGETAGDMTRIAERGALGVRDAEQATGEASDNVSGIAAATEELNASIREIARQVAESARVSQRAVEETQQTDETVRGLAESASRIGEVIGLISSIAAQTNLLALNATIEAARAGEAGKGFAVVASEVKSLANQTARATEEIGNQIASVRNVTQDAVRAISQIRGTIDEVNTVSTMIAAAIEEQGAALQEIARNTQMAAERTRKASGSVTAVSVETDATTHSAGAVQAAVNSLDREAGRLRQQVDTFMDRLRAA